MASVALLAALAGCDDVDENAEPDAAADTGTSEISTACMRDLPDPTVTTGAAARLTLTMENFRYSFEDDRNRFTHDRRFKESSGIGVYIFRGKVCVEDAGVCADACVRYRIEPGGSLTQRGHHVATPIDPDRITIQYWGRDDAGNLLTIQKELRTSGQTIEVTSD